MIAVFLMLSISTHHKTITTLLAMIGCAVFAVIVFRVVRVLLLMI